MQIGIIEQKEALNYMLAGKSIFTIVSLETGKRFTYKIKKFNDNFYISVLTGSDNNSMYSYIGMLELKKTIIIPTAKSKVFEDSISYKAFLYTFTILSKGQESKFIEIWHSGRCGRCGRLLTDPESVKTGYGSFCRSRK